MNYTTLASAETVARTIEGLKARNIEAETVASGAEALARLKTLIPKGASVSSGTSTTLNQIGFTDLLKSGAHEWNNLKAAIEAEKDPAKQSQLRRESALADYYLGSVHALSEDGQIIIASNSGSQLPAYAFTSPNVIWVVSTQKIMPTFEDAMKRLEEHVVPLEDERMKSTGAPGTKINKLLIFKGEPTYTGRKMHVIFVNEALGF